MNITDKNNKKYIREFNRVVNDPSLEQEIRENVFIGKDKTKYIFQIITIIALIFLITIGVNKTYKTFMEYVETGDIFFLIISLPPILALLYFAYKGFILFIESRMESNKRLVSAKRVKLIKKKEITRGWRNRRSNRRYENIYIFILSNGGDNIVINVASEQMFGKYKEGDMVPLYQINKKWWIFNKGEIIIY